MPPSERHEGVPYSEAGKRFLSIRASRGREVLAEELTKAGGVVEQLVVYDSVDVEQADVQLLRNGRGRNHWTTVTSSAIARSLAQLFGEFAPQNQARQHQPHHVGDAA